MSALAVAFPRFAEYLDRRLAEGQRMSEDTVRYAFFAALLDSTDLEQHEIQLELPHPHRPGKSIDTFVQGNSTRPKTYVEFKYDRASESTSPKPQKAGALFNDFARLALLSSQDAHCLVVYVTDAEMAAYFQKHDVGYSGFWQTRAGAVFFADGAFRARTTDTFRRLCGEEHAFELRLAHVASLNRGHELRVYEVRATVANE